MRFGRVDTATTRNSGRRIVAIAQVAGVHVSS
jgi:hypothetical protein